MRDCAFAGGIIVDGGGLRFADNTVNKSDLARAFHDFSSSDYSFPRVPGYLVLDAGRRTSWKIGPLGQADPDPVWLFKAPTLEGLAQQIGVPSRQLCETGGALHQFFGAWC